MKRSLIAAFAIIGLAINAALAAVIPYHFFSGASTNATLVVGGDHRVTAIVAVNTTATLYYLKLYDKSTAPTCNTDAVRWTIPVPASTSGGSISISIPEGLYFVNGVGFCITGASADNDNTNAATGVTVDFGIN